MVGEGEIGDFKMCYGGKMPKEGELCIFGQQNKSVIVAQEIVCSHARFYLTLFNLWRWSGGRETIALKGWQREYS